MGPQLPCLLLFTLSFGLASTRLPLAQARLFPPSNSSQLQPELEGEAEDGVQPFIYVYELPAVFNTGMQQYYPARLWGHDDQYDSDRELHEYLMSHPWRTHDPCKADLFLLPVYTSYMVQSFWLARFGWIDLQFDETHSGLRCERGVCSYAGHAMRAAITAVQRLFPFWNESNGANHLAVFPTDHGICDGMLLLLHNGSCAQMMGIHPQGEWAAPWQDAGWAGPPLEHTFCHRRGKDITIPPLVLNGSLNRVMQPTRYPRHIAVLARFTASCNTFGGVRPSLLKAFEEARDASAFEGQVDVGRGDYFDTLEEMERAVLCVTPPGLSTWTARMFRALMKGCIPVYFFEDTEMPFEELGLDWSRFSVNLPVDMAVHRPGEVIAHLQGLLANASRVREMQDTLADVQHLFNWDREDKHGAQAATLRALQVRAQQLAHFRKERTRECDAAAQVHAFHKWAHNANRRLEQAVAELPRDRVLAHQLFEAVVPDVAYPLFPKAHWNDPNNTAPGAWSSPWTAAGQWSSPWAFSSGGVPYERNDYY